jgi:hypothetical protein
MCMAVVTVRDSPLYCLVLWPRERVRTKCINTIYISLSLFGRAMIQAVRHREGPGSIIGQSLWGLWWTKWHWDGLSPSSSAFPYQCLSTNVPYLFSSTCSYYQKDKRAKPGNLPKSKIFSRQSGSIGHSSTITCSRHHHHHHHRRHHHRY